MSAESIDARLNGLVQRVHHVQRWLMLLFALRTLAGAGTFALAYLLLFSALDHRLHFGVIVRLIALALLFGGMVSVAYFLGRGALRHYSAHQAANYVERHRTYHQQLVTAIEYHENRASYPYSKSLAERVVVQVDDLARGHDFTNAVPKWQVYLSSAVIAIAVVALSVALIGNATFFARYFARLTQPFASVAPLPATTLEALTGDLVTQPDFNVTLAAAIHGKVPENGLLHMVTAGEQYGAAPPTFRDLNLVPSTGQDEVPQFASTVAFPLGSYAYQFVSGDAKTDWHAITVAHLPALKSLHAKVKATPDAEPYQQELRELSIDVLEGSEVTLIADASEPLSNAVVVGVDGEKSPVATNGAAHFEHTFRADKAGLINFELTSATGLTQDKLPPLQLALHADRAPEFKLVTPQGDYLATNVASIPVHIDVSDDFGITSAELVFEIAGGEPLRFPATVERGAGSASLAHTLELEAYDLSLNDTIVYYAEAVDVPSGIKKEGEHSASDLYLIEIKPYHQLWHQPADAMPSDFGKQGLGDMLDAHAGLTKVLEVARAILKKTWPLANKPQLNEDDRTKTASLLKDVNYNAEQIGKIKIDRSYRFSPEQRTRLDNAQRAYGSAAKGLAAYDPAAALGPEKQAYQDLRAVLEELEKAMMFGGGGGPPPGPEGVTLEEQVHLTRFEKEQTEWELKQLANKLEQIRQEQKELKERFARFLKAQGRQEGVAQKTTDEKSWTDPNAPDRNEDNPPSPEGGAAGGAESRTTLEGALPPGEAAGGSGSGSSGSSGSGTDTTERTAKTASREELLEVMRASQRALQQRVEQVNDSLEARNDEQTPAEDRAKAREHLANALEEMKKVDAALGEAYFGKGDAATKRAAQAFDAAQRELDMATFMLEQAALISDQEHAAKLLRQQAEAAATFARALEDADTAEDYADELVHLRDAWKQFAEQVGSEYVSSHHTGRGAPPNFTVLAHPLVPTADKSNLQPWKDPEQIRAARWLASQYSTLAIDAERLRGNLRGDDTSDAGFTNVENTYFERAAAYDPGRAP